MKIAFIGQKGIPAKFGGVERHVEELATNLAQNGHEVFVYARKNYTDENIQEYKGVKIIILPSISSKHLDAISHTLFSTIHALFQGYDVIHFHSIGPTFLSFLVRIFGGKTKLVATYHCQDYYHQKWSWFARKCLQLGEWMTCKMPHKTITVSKILTSFVKNEYETDATYIPNGYSISRTQNINEIAQWGLKKNEFILSVSRLIKHKGIHYLISAFKDLEDRGLTAGKKLVIVGDGFYSAEYVTFLKTLANNRQNIIFTGSQEGETLAELFENAYLFVQPSQSEGLSITLLEAMGYGKGILVSDIPENMEPISQTSFNFENGNAEDLTKKLEYLLKNPEDVTKEGLRAKNIAEDKFNWKNITQRVEGLYLELVSQK